MSDEWIKEYQAAVEPLMRKIVHTPRLISTNRGVIIFRTFIPFECESSIWRGSWRDVHIVIHLLDVEEDNECHDFVITIFFNGFTHSKRVEGRFDHAIRELEHLIIDVLHMSIADAYEVSGFIYGKHTDINSWWLGEHIITATKFNDNSGWTFIAETLESNDRTVYPVTIEPSRALLLEWLDKIITDVE